MSIPVFRSFIKRKDMDAVLTCLVSDQLGAGGEARLLVAELAERFGAAPGLAVREWPRAMGLALASLGLAPGARIGVGALSSRLWDAAISQAGCEAVLVDCSEHNPSLNAEALAQVHAAAPLAAVVVGNELGVAADFAAVRALGVPVINDLTSLIGQRALAPEAEATDCGDCLLVGLEPGDPVTAGGGVALLAGRFGAFAKPVQQALRQAAEQLPPEVLLPDMNAALGRTQNRELAGFMERRLAIQESFRRAALRGHHKLLHPADGGELAAACFPLVVESGVSEVQVYARKKNVETVHAFAQSILASRGGDEAFDQRRFPKALGLSLRCLLFPLFPGLSQKEIETIEKVIATLP